MLLWTFDPFLSLVIIVSPAQSAIFACFLQKQFKYFYANHLPHFQVFFSMNLLFDEMDLTSAWLGASDMYKEGVWRNIDNSPFPEDVWGPGQPESLSPENDCLLYSDSELNDTNCLLTADSAICQRPTMNMNACPPNYARFFGNLSLLYY